MPKDVITHQRLTELLHYDSETGIFTRLIDFSNRFRAGMRAGTVYKNGYRYLALDGNNYLEHRLAWFYINGSWPTFHIDHKDLDKTNNRIDNLRDIPKKDNNRNVVKRRSNTTGAKGVVLTRYKKFKAQITIDGTTHYLGSFPTLEAASDAYDDAAIKYFGECALTNKMIRERELEARRSNQ